MTTVGIVGLGLIGGTLAQRLADKGDPPVVFDLQQDAVDSAQRGGAIAVGSSRELAERCDLVLVCVQTDEQCVAAISGENGVLQGAGPGSCIAVLSTVLPATIISLAALATERGVDLVDTPVAGRGMFSVKDGTMSVLVGDEGELFKRLEPTMLRFASRVVPVGRLGSGAALKLAHNVIVYAGFASVIEAAELARAAGVRDGLLEQVAAGSGALSELSALHHEFYKHRRDESHLATEDQMVTVAAALVDKDLSDAVALAETYGVALPVARLLSHSGEKIFQV
jgi:3-hydroxyisobutyrate dehydrogenase-like beta-hydroxyacid dehydrogenase